MEKALELLAKTRVVPVIQIDNLDDAIPLAETLVKNGLPIAEVTLRSPVAMDAIRLISQKLPEMLVIAGTVTSPERAAQVMEAGASMVVSPGFNPKTVGYCVSNGIDIIPGVATPGEMEQAMNFGLSTVKFFPAEANGGIATLKAVSAPYSQLKFMPTGGITPANIQDYLALPSVTCCGGSWMVDKKLIANKDWGKLAELIRKAVEQVQI
ncbi:bifunctional 4-hydroxy-2-oxoglutarate aldolase/2-dehydro-3-deoxy-phosphogluconate aldolase [Vibrio sp. JC009]|uniref:bifunctional 4-hydroxy-2-oxoglutarate aldolase/2-dehydro-3-deoxy-phosphogluconate aldolase n=1 Tax=Vibrio sp. JC009 TaxID=2912314 RepID=UPI0023B06484|nr:bifunctional 4-hydroxy-2-oxoglutarate aldolase/2-dehydro-3-deoxy-phosphogluconate aldolase [Vibrio sp. JC009]WED23428.1 bifunctional 4-hydroxy-2-oxoglutarate aldolase/2-dehydro-3-deoxy-phosphogluconate aldolase [Vibrio sp. JC009]